MTKQSIIALSILFVILIVGMFVFVNNQQKTADVDLEQNEEESDTANDTLPWYFADGVTAKHFFIDGEHTLTGEIILPTPCDLLETEMVVRESFPEQIELKFSIINSAEACAQVLTTQRFKVSAKASEEAVFSASYNNLPVSLNLVPATEGETPEDFEIFIKG